MKLELNQEEKILLLSTKLYLNDDEINKIDNFIVKHVNWDTFSKKIFSNGLSQLIYKNFKKLPNKDLIPLQILSRLKQSYIRTHFNNTQKNNDLTSVLSIFSENNIDFIPLKGMILIHFLYNDFGLRPMSDIDLLVKDENIEQCKILLLNSGWEIFEELYVSEFAAKKLDSHHPYTFTKKNTKIELHNKIHDRLTSYNININDYWSRSIQINFLTYKAYNFNPTDLLQHLCLHLFKHLTNDKHIAMKHFCDISEYIQQNNNNIQWDLLLQTSKKYNCEIEVKEILILCKKFFDAPIENSIITKFEKNTTIDCDFLFIHYLRNNQKEIDNYLPKKHLRNRLTRFFKIKGIWNKTLFLYSLFLPNKNYMIKKYEIKNQKTLPYYYIRRIILLDIFKGLSH